MLRAAGDGCCVGQFRFQRLELSSMSKEAEQSEEYAGSLQTNFCLEAHFRLKLMQCLLCLPVFPMQMFY